MGFDRARLTAAVVVAAGLGLGPWAVTAEAQYFGRNKVQYENFDFKVLKTQHFDIHYYPEAREAIEPIIANKSFNKKSPDEQREIMRTYGSLGEGSFDFLEAVIDGRLKHLNEKARAMAAYGLAMIQSRDAIRLLTDLAGHGEGPMRNAAAEAYSTISQ